MGTDNNDLTYEQTKELVKRLGGMEVVHAILQGRYKIELIKHIINLAIKAAIPFQWGGGNRIREHRTGSATYEWNPDKLELYLSDQQKGGRKVCGFELRHELAEKPVMNASLLDYLLVHPELIPEEWKSKIICFWGTTYDGTDDGQPRIRYLGWSHDHWFSRYTRVSSEFGPDEPALVSAGY